MEWKIQDNNNLSNIINNIAVEAIYDRLSLLTGMDKKKIKNTIDAEEINTILASILLTNNAVDKDSVDKFVNNIGEAFESPYRLTNAKKAADKITEFLNKENGHIYVYADYDGDGICAGTLMKLGLEEHSNGKVTVKFPNREDGYGINKDFCKKLIEKHKDNTKDILVVTVDNGITKIEEVDMLLKAGIEIIITDHHNSDKDAGIPNCLIVNPHNAFEKQDEITKCYCGTTVAFKVLQLIKENFGSDNLLDYVPYAAVATVTDVMPLSAENNAFIQYAIEMINRKDTCPEFFNEFIKATDIDLFTTEQIAWTLGPALNACGRLGCTEVGAKALINPTEENILNILKVNGDRKFITDSFKAKVKELNYTDKVIVHIADPKECPRGTIGILAGKLAEHFNRPSIAMLEHNGKVHGSIRSVSGINMYKILGEFKDNGLIESYGGHAEACVCEFKVSKKEDVIKAFNALDLMKYSSSIADEAQTITLDITLGHLNKIVYALTNMIIVDKCKSPIFVINDVTVQSATRSKKNPSNIKLTLKDNGTVRTMWAWGLGDKVVDILEKYSTISLIGGIKKNFMGNGYIFDIKDIY